VPGSDFAQTKAAGLTFVQGFTARPVDSLKKDTEGI
jgi:hypothetical protein